MGARIYGAMFYCFGTGSILGYLLQLYVVQFVGYQGLFLIMGGLSVLALVILTFFNENNSWTNHNSKENCRIINELN